MGPVSGPSVINRKLYDFELPTDAIKDRVLNILKAYFSRHPKFPWKANEEETVIRIVDHFALNLESASKKPIVAVRRGPMGWRDQHIDQLLWTNFADRDIYSDILGSAIQIGVYSRVGLEAEMIAGYIFGLFTYFKSFLREHGLFTVKAAQLGEEQALKAESDITIALVPVVVQIEYNESWVVDENEELLADVIVRKVADQ